MKQHTHTHTHTHRHITYNCKACTGMHWHMNMLHALPEEACSSSSSYTTNKQTNQQINGVTIYQQQCQRQKQSFLHSLQLLSDIIIVLIVPPLECHHSASNE